MPLSSSRVGGRCRRSGRRTLPRGSGEPIEKSASSMPAAISARERLVRRLRRAGHDRQLRALRRCAARLRRDAPRAARAASSSRAGSASATCRKPEPVAAFSSRLVPSAIFLPWSMTAMRAASWSASSRYCVVSRMVTPESGERRGSCATRPGAHSGSRPVVGSSRNSTPGVTISEAAMSSLRRMPPE